MSYISLMWFSFRKYTVTHLAVLKNFLFEYFWEDWPVTSWLFLFFLGGMLPFSSLLTLVVFRCTDECVCEGFWCFFKWLWVFPRVTIFTAAVLQTLSFLALAELRWSRLGTHWRPLEQERPDCSDGCLFLWSLTNGKSKCKWLKLFSQWLLSRPINRRLKALSSTEVILTQ